MFMELNLFLMHYINLTLLIFVSLFSLRECIQLICYFCFSDTSEKNTERRNEQKTDIRNCLKFKSYN